MKTIKGAFTLAFAMLLTLGVSGQSSSIGFYKTDLTSALKIAKRENKNIFIDTYAPWCKPCKQMDIEFRNNHLSTYFNRNFVNVKINMDSDIGKELYRRYSVIFLPTLLILDQDGNVKIMIDRLIKADNLLDIARQINEGYSTPKSSKPIVKNNPAPRKTPTTNNTISKPPVGTQKNPVSDSTIAINKESKTNNKTSPSIPGTKNENEKILYVLGEGSGELPPEILKQEAYFRMKLMDGSHLAAAKKYLDTQLDWGTHENTSFIFDFLHTTQSDEFEFLIENRSNFEKQLGYDNIAKTVNILVHSQLYQGYPRPDLSNAILLYSYVDPINYEPRAYEYYLDRLWNENKFKEFKSIANSYLNNINSEDDLLIYKWVCAHSELDLTDVKTLIKCIASLEKAVEIDGSSFDYHEKLAHLYFVDHQQKKARLTALRAIELANEEDDTNSLKLLLERL